MAGLLMSKKKLKKLETWRKKTGLSKTELASMLGITNINYGYWCNEDRIPEKHFSNVDKILAADPHAYIDGFVPAESLFLFVMRVIPYLSFSRKKQIVKECGCPKVWKMAQANISWTSKVREAAQHELIDMPELNEVAARLEVHPQTLRRRLETEGTTLKNIKNQLRRDTALYYLGKEDLSIEEIAYRAGFSESSAFIRAFKDWTGTTPGTYRKDHLDHGKYNVLAPRMAQKSED